MEKAKQTGGYYFLFWSANLTTINRRKTVVLMNDSNQYRIVLHGLKAKDSNKLDQLAIETICDTLMEDCIKTILLSRNCMDVLQVAFGRRDYHLLNYYIFDGEKPIENLVCSDEAFEYPNDVPIKTVIICYCRWKKRIS